MRLLDEQYIRTPFYGIDKMTATVSGSQEGRRSDNMVNGSELDFNDLHSTESAAMWLSSSTRPQ